ncbi:MAG: T9SS type A sorting domain-containing protein, partial [Paludibacter sp.]
HYSEFEYQIIHEPEVCVNNTIIPLYDFESPVGSQMAWLKTRISFGEHHIKYSSGFFSNPPLSPFHNSMWRNVGRSANDLHYYSKSRQYSSVLHSRWGIHVTDPANLQSALNSVNATSGVPVYVDQSMTINTDLNISSGAKLIISSGTTITFASNQQGDNFGGDSQRCEIVIQDGASFVIETNVTLTSSGIWGGVYKHSAGAINLGECTIENANIGIHVNGSSERIEGPSQSNKAKMKNCNEGIRLYDSTADIYNIEFENCQTGLTASGVLTTSQAYINHTSFHGTSSTHALTALNYSCPSLRQSYIDENITGHKIYLTEYGSINLVDGYNNIYDNLFSTNSYNIFIDSTCPVILSSHNYWGTQYPESQKGVITNNPAKLDWTNPSNEHFLWSWKIASSVENQFHTAQSHVMNRSFDEALQVYDTILKDNTNDSNVRLYALLGIVSLKYKKKDDLTGVKNLVQSEISKATDKNIFFLKYALSDISIHLKEYRASEYILTEMLSEYHGKPEEISILVKLAQLYGQNNNNKNAAKYYADKANELNAPPLLLVDAYSAAGIGYEYSLADDGIQKDFNTDLSLTPTNEYFTVFPNPANPNTTFSFSIKAASHVKLSIYSITGQRVNTLIDTNKSAGAHSVTFNGSRFASGVYFYKFESNSFVKNGKILLLK